MIEREKMKIKKEGAFAMTTPLLFLLGMVGSSFLPFQIDSNDLPQLEVHNSVKTDPNSTAEPLFLPQAVLPSRLNFVGPCLFLPSD